MSVQSVKWVSSMLKPYISTLYDLKLFIIVIKYIIRSADKNTAPCRESIPQGEIYDLNFLLERT